MTDADSGNVTQIINLLADGQTHSGEELGRALGISRAGIWKRLQALEPLGLFIDSVKGSGYRLPGGLQLLEKESILGYLEDDVRIRLMHSLTLFNEIDSTNTWLLQNSLGKGRVCLTERQSDGRGRRGRQWFSPYGKNLYLSLSWSWSEGISVIQGLSLAIGVEIAEMLRDLGLVGVELKWPNDIVHQQRKLGGILIELAGGVSEDCRVIVGIGLNVAMSDLPDARLAVIEQAWVDLKQLGLNIDRNHLAAALLNRLLPALEHYGKVGFSSYKERWESLNAHRLQDVRLETALRPPMEGRVLGVDEQGGLRLATTAGEVVVSGGEISLRPLYAT